MVFVLFNVVEFFMLLFVVVVVVGVQILFSLHQVFDCIDGDGG